MTRGLLCLGAVEHSLAKVSGDPAWLLDAFEHTHEALRSDPASLPGLFNQALIATDLGLCRVALGAWRRFLAQDASSAWAEEAGERQRLLQCLAGQRVIRKPHAVDTLFETAHEELLPKSIDTAEVGMPLADLSQAGKELAEVAGDLFVQRLAAEVATIVDPMHRDAIWNYAAGRRSFGQGDYEGARELLLLARSTLRRHGSVLVPWCDVWLAGVEIFLDIDYPAAQRRLSPHLDSVASTYSPMLAGRLFWTSGLAFLRDGRLRDAHDRFVHAERSFQQGGYTANLASIRLLRAMALRNLGFFRQSWWDWTRGVRALQSPRPRFMLHNGLLEGATLAQMMEAEAVAEALLEEAAASASEGADLAKQTEVSLWRARSLRQRGAHERATREFQAVLRA